jgi:hypothetical protein
MIFYVCQGRSVTKVANLKRKGITKIVIITCSGMVKTTYENKKDIDNIFKLLDGDHIAIENQFEGKCYKIVNGDFNEYKIDLMTTNNN